MPTLGRVHHQLPALPVQRDLLVPDLPEEVHALARGLEQRRSQLVLRQPHFQRAPQRRLGPEEAIGRHQAVDALVRPEKVVVREEVRQPVSWLSRRSRGVGLARLCQAYQPLRETPRALHIRVIG